MHAFVICESLDSVVIPEGVTQIGDRAFQSCKALKSVALPQSLEKISLGAFSWCESLESIAIPKTVKEIEDGAFRYCGFSEDFKTEAAGWRFENSLAIKDNKVMYCTNKKADKISIPQDVTEIGEWAFYECRFAEDFVLEAAGWRFVNSLAIKDNIVMYCTNRNAQKITIPEGLVKIGKRAFERCELLESVQIPNSVQEIEEYAFHGCSSLYSLTIPDSANVSEDAFGLGCEVARR